jgi:uncharacterized protein YxjI
MAWMKGGATHMPSSGEDAQQDRQRLIRIPPEGDSLPSTYKIMETLLPIGDDFVVEDAYGRTALRVDGKLLSLRESLTVQASDGQELYQIRGTVLDVKNVLNVSRYGEVLATVRRRRDRDTSEQFTVELPQGDELTVEGDVADREYLLTFAERRVARVSRPLIPHFRDPFDVEIARNQEERLIVAIVVCLHVMTRA